MMGWSLQSPQDPSDEFVYLWQNIPPGSSYTIYYQTFGSSAVYAQDGPFTVQ